MSKRERDQLMHLIARPVEGSKIAAAVSFGIDLTLVLRKLQLTPTARLRELAEAQTFVEELQRSGKRQR